VGSRPRSTPSGSVASDSTSNSGAC
jgi:hypothetical protein